MGPKFAPTPLTFADCGMKAEPTKPLELPQNSVDLIETPWGDLRAEDILGFSYEHANLIINLTIEKHECVDKKSSFWLLFGLLLESPLHCRVNLFA